MPSPHNIVQNKTAIGPGTNPSGASGFGFDSAPTIGNLVLCFLGINVARSSITINTAFWSVLHWVQGDNDDTPIQVVLYRYVQSGDTSALAAPTTSGSTYWAWSLAEVDGVTGVITDDVIACFGAAASDDQVMAAYECPIADALVLAGLSNYNGGTNPSITTGAHAWTLDSAANNSSNYGSSGLFHQYPASGDLIDGTAVFVNDRSAWCWLIIAPAKPVVPYIAGAMRRVGNRWNQPQVLSKIPDPANFLVLVLWRDSGGGGYTPAPTGTWSQVDTLPNGGNFHGGLFYRAVEAGDADSIIDAPMGSASGSFDLLQIIEVGGMADFLAELVGVDKGRTTSGATLTTGALTTDAADQLGILIAANYNQSVPPVLTGGVTWDGIFLKGANSGSYGSWTEAAHLYPTPGTIVNQVISRSGDALGYFLLLLGPAGSGGGSGESSGGPDLAPANVTQVARMVVEDGPGEARATQVVRLLPSSIAPPVRTTRESRLIVADVVVTPRVTQAFRLTVAAGVGCVTKWCQCWRITRRDGVIFRFTSLDVAFLWGSELFKACGSLLPSATEDSSQVGAVSNQELKGIFSDEGIDEAELFGGLFDDAYVEVWLVAWEGPEAPRLLASGWTGNLQHQEGTFNMEVVGPGAKIDQQALVQNYGPGCRWVFGSAACGYDREAVKRTGAVTAAFNRGNFIATVDLDDGGLQWADGLVRWTSGANDGIETEVKEATFDGGGNVSVELWDLVGLAIEPGDTFELLPGCDLSFATCKAVYNNAINFGGFKDVPGEDSVVQTPDAKLS